MTTFPPNFCRIKSRNVYLNYTLYIIPTSLSAMCHQTLFNDHVILHIYLALCEILHVTTKIIIVWNDESLVLPAIVQEAIATTAISFVRLYLYTRSRIVPADMNSVPMIIKARTPYSQAGTEIMMRLSYIRSFPRTFKWVPWDPVLTEIKRQACYSDARCVCRGGAKYTILGVGGKLRYI